MAELKTRLTDGGVDAFIEYLAARRRYLARLLKASVGIT